MIAFYLFHFPHFLEPVSHLWYPEENHWYAWASSWGGDTAIFAGILVFWTRHNCHIHRCWRLSWKTDPQDGFNKCKAHHPDHPAKTWFRNDRSHIRHASNN